jgi:hypothetical protein
MIIKIKIIADGVYLENDFIIKLIGPLGIRKRVIF